MIDRPTSSFQRGRWDSPSTIWFTASSPAASTTVWATVAGAAQHGGPELAASLGRLDRLVDALGLPLVGRLDMEHVQRPAAAPGHAGGPPDQLARVGPAVDADHHPLAHGLARSGPGQLGAEQVALLPLGDLAQGQGPQGGQVVDAEEVQQAGRTLSGA